MAQFLGGVLGPSCPESSSDALTQTNTILLNGFVLWGEKLNCCKPSISSVSADADTALRCCTYAGFKHSASSTPNSQLFTTFPGVTHVNYITHTRAQKPCTSNSWNHLHLIVSTQLQRRWSRDLEWKGASCFKSISSLSLFYH